MKIKLIRTVLQNKDLQGNPQLYPCDISNWRYVGGDFTEHTVKHLTIRAHPRRQLPHDNAYSLELKMARILQEWQDTPYATYCIRYRTWDGLWRYYLRTDTSIRL